MLAVGTQLGPYEIISKLGAGGMGEVYRAKDSRLEREVAVKVLPRQFAEDAARLARFEREAKAVAALSHPNILAIHDYGTAAGQTFAVMELLEGQTLRARIGRGKIPWRRAVEIAVALADGLAAAHGKGIVHRDLKPDNVFLTDDGRVKILDFGLARNITPELPCGDALTASYDAAKTETGAVLGTVGYMSPEQVRGQEVDVRSDVFSLGCVLYEMVSGEKAFARRSAVESMAAVLHDEPADLLDSDAKAPSELNRIIKHCLEKNPEQRFHAARDLAFALRAIPIDPHAPTSRLSAPPASRSALVFRVIAACVFLGTCMAVGFLIDRIGNPTQATSDKSPRQTFDSLAILPLTNLTGDETGEPLCVGLAEQVSSSLSQVGQIKVRPITSTLRYGGKTVDAKTLGRELDVAAVVTGRLRQEAETLVIALELVDARDNSLVWSQQYKGSRQKILDLQDNLARDLAGKLGLRLTREQDQRLTKRYTEDPDAYLLYREGQYHWSKFSPEGLKTAEEYFQRAIQKDPNYALAYTGLGQYYVLLGTIYRGPQATFADARKYVDRALAIDDSLAEAHCELATIYMFGDWDWPAAEREFKRAIALNAEIHSQHLYGFYLAAMGRPNDALPYLKRSKELAPGAAQKCYELAMGYNWMRQYDLAITASKAAIALNSNFSQAYRELGLAYSQKQMYAAAETALRQGMEIEGKSPQLRGMLGYVYAVGDKQADAQKILDELMEPVQRRYGTAFAIARVYAGLGENDQALTWLRKAGDERDVGVIWLKVDPTLDRLRSDAGFAQLLKEVRLSE